MTRGAEVRLAAVGYRYPMSNTHLPVLEDISFQVSPGKCLAIVGPSGSGKTTLLRILMGLLRPTSGEVQIASEVDHPLRRAVVFQKPTLLPWLTARENVSLPLELEGREEGAADRVSRELARVGLGAFAEFRPSELSGGMQSRVALARALATDPDLLMLDEPFSDLDEATSEDLLVQMSGLIEESGATVIFITHSLTQAAFLADHILLLSSLPGRTFGAFDVGATRPRKREYLEDPAMFALVQKLRASLREAIHAVDK